MVVHVCSGTAAHHAESWQIKVVKAVVASFAWVKAAHVHLNLKTLQDAIWPDSHDHISKLRLIHEVSLG